MTVDSVVRLKSIVSSMAIYVYPTKGFCRTLWDNHFDGCHFKLTAKSRTIANFLFLHAAVFTRALWLNTLYVGFNVLSTKPILDTFCLSMDDLTKTFHFFSLTQKKITINALINWKKRGIVGTMKFGFGHLIVLLSANYTKTVIAQQ